MPKTWEATGLKMGKIELEQIEDTNSPNYPGVRVTRYYQYVGADGKVIPGISSSGITKEFKNADIPTEILSALSAIDKYTTEQAKLKEGM